METITWPERYLLHVEKEIFIQAPTSVTFEALLEQISSGLDRPDGTPVPTKLEPWPGGRWYRDLGQNTGHWWGHVQVIKPPTLLELCGPMFMSYPVASHVQFRLTEVGGGTRLVVVHRAMGEILPEHREGVTMGWQHILSRVKGRCGGK